MALSTHPIYGDTEALYNILSTSGLFASVTKSIVESVKTITCSDLTGPRLTIKVTNVEADGSGGSQCGYTYHYGGNKSWYCLDFDGSYETDTSRFPYIVYQTTSTIVIVAAARNATNPEWPLKLLVLTKDNNGYVGVLTSNSYNNGLWGNDLPRSISKDANSPLQYGSNNPCATLSSASTLVPFTTNDASKVTFFPKLFRAVATQYRTDQIGLASLNNNEYLSLYGAAFVRID